MLGLILAIFKRARANLLPTPKIINLRINDNKNRNL
jgi:hypothetical protein